MTVVSMHQAKSTLSQLVKRAATGETILLGAYGKAEAKLVPAGEHELPGKRIGVLAGKPAFGNEQMPLGPKALCRCLQQAIECLDLGPNDSRQIYHLFDRHVFGHFAELMKVCNRHLSEHGVLPNLSYVPFRNPELRFKKTPIALGEGKEPTAASAKVYPLFPEGAPAKAQGAAAPAEVEESFSKLQHLLAKVFLSQSTTNSLALTPSFHHRYC